MHIFTAGMVFGVVQRHFELFSLSAQLLLHLFALWKGHSLSESSKATLSRVLSLRLCVSKVLIIVVHYHAAEICWCTREREALLLCAGVCNEKKQRQSRQAGAASLYLLLRRALWADNDDEEWPPTYFLCHQQASEGQPGSICCAPLIQYLLLPWLACWNVCCVTQQQST